MPALNRVDVLAAAPLIVLVCAAALLIFLEGRSKAAARLAVTSAGLLGAVFFVPLQLLLSGTAWHGSLVLDGLGCIFSLLILSAALVSLLLSSGQAEGQRISSAADYEILVLLAVAGALVMACAAHLLVLFLGFELLSISVYVLTGSAREEKASAEGAMRLLLGSFSSAFMLYGIVLLYAAAGSLEMVQVGAAAAAGGNPLVLAGLALLIFGLAFKVGLVPFHVWTPDVYQGAPTSAAAFMAAVVKAAAFAALLRVVLFALAPVLERWTEVFWWVSAATMTLGNLAALQQPSIKRMLAYSSIAHAGYIFMAFLAPASPSARSALVFYLVVYSFMTLGAFGAVLLATTGSSKQYERDNFDAFSGLYETRPYLSLALAVCILSLAGFPPLGGFFAKLYLFRAMIEAGQTPLVIIAALNSAVALYYYLRVLVAVYFGHAAQSAPAGRPAAFAPCCGLGAAAALTVIFGVFFSYWAGFIDSVLAV